MPGLNEKLARIGFKGQEGDCRLQESNWAFGRSSGAFDILLRGGIQLS
jgi:hypothetical protein